MPLLKKQPFVPLPPPESVKRNEQLFFLQTTKEFFRKYDDFFERVIQLNSMIWTCSVTSRNNLTYEEALDSEQKAMQSLQSFPDFLELPLLYLIHRLSYRGRMDDLIDDLHKFMKDRYFVGEEVNFLEDRKKKRARITHADCIGGTSTAEEAKGRNSDEMNESFTNGLHQNNITSTPRPANNVMKCESVANYRYTVQIVQSDSDEDSSFEVDADKSEDDGIREGVIAKSLSRPKTSVSRPKLKLFVKNSTVLDGDRWVVKDMLVSDYLLDTKEWNSVFGGPIPEFPKTPLKRLAQSLQPTGTGAKERKKPGPKPGSRRSGANSHKVDAKTRKAIEKQRDELRYYLTQAQKFEIDDLNKFDRYDRLLSLEEVEELKELVKSCRAEERDKTRDKKKAMKELQLEWKRPRDDLICEDLMPLPSPIPITFPPCLPSSSFGDFLSVLEFFWSFSDCLNIKNFHTSNRIGFNELMAAICDNEKRTELKDIFAILLHAKAERVQEEDGDEASLENKEELSVENCDLDHKLYGLQLRQATLRHEAIRNTHGMSVRQLPIDCETLSEIVSLHLQTAAYYTGHVTSRFRCTHRGGFRCWDDPGLHFNRQYPHIKAHLQTKSLFDLPPTDRLLLLKLLTDQLMCFFRFRQSQEDKFLKLSDLKKDLKNFHAWDQQQDKEARTARLSLEWEADVIKEKGAEAAELEITKREPSKNTLQLKQYLRFQKQGGTASRKTTDIVEELMFEGINYDELEMEEVQLAREIQTEKVEAEERRLLKLIFDCQSKCGHITLGHDRAFRTYIFSDNVPAFLVRNPTLLDYIGTCDRATPIGKNDNADLLLSTPNIDEYTRLFACSGDASNCPVHLLPNETEKWSFINSTHQLEELISGCNQRGYRESELLENLRFCRIRLESILENCERSYEGFLFNFDKYINTKSIENNFRDALLELEEKIFDGGLGSLHTENREFWREKLRIDGDVTSICPSVSIDNQEMYTTEEVSQLSDVSKLAIALLQIAQSVHVRFLKLPFFEPFDEGEKKDANAYATETFVLWQKSVLNCGSISAVALHLATYELGIQWNKSRLQAKCRVCRRKGGSAGTSILCSICDRCYHIGCLRPAPISPLNCSDWECADCNNLRKDKERQQRLAEMQNGFKKDTCNDDLYSDEHTSDDNEQSESESEPTPCAHCHTDFSSTDQRISCAECEHLFHLECVGLRSARNKSDWMCARCKPENNQSNTSIRSPSALVTTSSGRIVRKTKFLDTTEDSNKLMAVRKRSRRISPHLLNGYQESSSEDGEEERRRKRSRRDDNLSAASVRSLSIGLRDGNWGKSHNLFNQCEKIIRDTMKLDCAILFCDPVDKKEVPDYYTVIEEPMALRTMLNKLKNHQYDSPTEVHSDAKLLIANCRRYNEDESEISKEANELEKYLEGRFAQLCDANGGK